jgi:aminoglycoside phosphotransferase (APT) family kinase protein
VEFGGRFAGEAEESAAVSHSRMHTDEVEIDDDLVRALLSQQYPEWVRLPLERVESAGTDNAIYRLGDELVVRLPRIGWAVHQVEIEREWLPRLAPSLPLEIPTPVATGAPGAGYPWAWAVHRWIPGENFALGRVEGLDAAARDVAHFLVALRTIDATDGLPARAGQRGAPLAPRDPDTRAALEALRDELDVDAALRVWGSALAAGEWGRAPVWFHGDMLPGNVIVRDGRVRAVIDFSAVGVGDPACDLMIAWALFSGESRARFRRAVDVDDATWARGRGHALSQAALFIPYYRDTNPLGVARARHLIAEVLADPD